MNMLENLTGNLKMYVESGVQVNINNLTIAGEKKREAQGLASKNATILHDAPIVMVDGAKCTKADLTLAYNLFEQPYNSTSKKVSKFVAKNCVLNTANATHNVFNLYKFEDGATVEFDSCEFVLNPNGNCIRFDNMTGAKNILIVFNNCKWNYDPEASESTYAADKEWLSLMGFENATLKNQAVFGSELNWKVIIKDCSYDGNAIEPNFESYAELTTEGQEGKHEEGKAIMWMYDDGAGFIKVDEHPEYFPQVTIQYGSEKKVYKA